MNRMSVATVSETIPASPVTVRACDCGGSCDGCAEDVRKGIQKQPAGPVLGTPGDRYEREADRIADQVISGESRPAAPVTVSPLIQRTEEPDEDEEVLQAKAANSEGPDGCIKAGATAAGATGAAAEAVSSGGRPLALPERQYFEPRFGRDLGAVRIHTDVDAARRLHARAFTLGNHIAFAPGSFDRHSGEGRRLIAHELVHTLQQDSADSPSVQRSVGSSSRCTGGENGAPADSGATLTRLDALAQRMSLGTSITLSFASASLGDTSFEFAVDAYGDWFGSPVQTNDGRFLSRFRSEPFDTEEEAVGHEIDTLSRRFRQIHEWLAGDITYVCVGETETFTIPGCKPNRCQDVVGDAHTCAAGSRTIVLCPSFWGGGDAARATLLIHETTHPLFHFTAHEADSARQRARNAYCYQNLAAEAYGLKVHDGGECPRL